LDFPSTYYTIQLRFANKQSEIILIYFDRRKGTWTKDLFLTGYMRFGAYVMDQKSYLILITLQQIRRRCLNYN